MKKLFLSAFASVIIVSLFAQDSTSVYKPPTRNRKNAKKERMQNMMKMEEEGDLIFNKHNVFGIRLATDGYGISFEKGKFKTPSRTLLYQFELNEKKSNKEHKITTTDGFNYNSVVPYKLNNFYIFKASIGEMRLIGGKGNKNGVSVSALYSGGVSVGLLKPYYVNVDNGQATSQMTMEAFLKDTTGLVATGAAGPFVGWGHLSVKPGLNAKTAMRFDYGRLNQTISAIEVGLTGEFYLSKIPQVSLVPQKQFFFNAYLCLLLGSRK